MPVKRYFLKGIDYFQLLIDHHNKRYGGPGHEARLALFLQGKISEKEVMSLLEQSEICGQLREVRISKSRGLGYPSLVFTGKKKKIPVTSLQLDTNDIPDELLNIPVDVYHQPPFHLSIINFKNGNSCVLFTFHHILFDFAGVQSFLYSLTGIKRVPLIPDNIPQPVFSTRIKRFFKAVVFTFREGNSRMTIPERPLPVKKPLRIIYRELQFSGEETEKISNNYNRYGLQINKSIFQAACVCKALHDEIFCKQKNHRFIWLPVPVNFRRKGTADAILFNGLSFLFYKLRHSELNSLDQIIVSLMGQMKDQVRNELPQAFIDFADGYRYMPMPFYYPMMNLPSLGKLSSFSFSTLGNTFPLIKEFMGFPVTEVKNYPSNSIAPGITFLFYEFRGTLRLMTSWVQGQYTPDEQDMVLTRIKTLMIS